MKIRLSHVTNSSSSSFLAIIRMDVFEKVVESLPEALRVLFSVQTVLGQEAAVYSWSRERDADESSHYYFFEDLWEKANLTEEQIDTLCDEFGCCLDDAQDLHDVATQIVNRASKEDKDAVFVDRG